MATTTEVVYTRSQICEKVYAITGRFVSEDDSFYKWLESTLTKLQPLYTERDLKKFLFVGFSLYIKRNFHVAKQVLALDLKNNKLLYSEGVSVAEFVATHPTIQIAQIKRRELSLKQKHVTSSSNSNRNLPSTLRRVQVLEAISA